MTYQEILKTHEVVRVGFPKKGDLFIAHKNHGGHCEVVKADKDIKMIMCTIVKKAV